jgi:hypothetical protein
MPAKPHWLAISPVTVGVGSVVAVAVLVAHQNEYRLGSILRRATLAGSCVAFIRAGSGSETQVRKTAD